MGQDAAAFGAGILANQFVDCYIEESIETLVNRNNRKKLNFRIFQQTALRKNIDPSNVRGTGFVREYVPNYM